MVDRMLTALLWMCVLLICVIAVAGLAGLLVMTIRWVVSL